MNFQQIQHINTLFKSFDHSTNLIQICEKCFKEDNLLICEVCKLFFHLECENPNKSTVIPEIFLCSNCKNFKSPQNIGLKQKMLETKNFFPQIVKTISNYNKEINTSANINSNNNNNNNIISNVSNNNINNSSSNIISNNIKSTKINNEDKSNFYNEIKIISRQNSTINIKDKEEMLLKKKRSRRGAIEDFPFYEQATNIASGKNKFLSNASSLFFNNDRNPISNLPALSNIGRSNENVPLYSEHRKMFSHNFTQNQKEKRAIHFFENKDINFKKRKIKIGDNYNVNMNNFLKERYDEHIDDDEDNCPPRKVWDSENKLSDDELQQYLRDARFFWDYKKENLENELCTEFFEYFKDITKDNNDKDFIKLSKDQINNLMGFVKFGKRLNNHFEEMAMKILHLTEYSTKKALYFLFKRMNPFVEDAVEGFKHDVNFMQREAIVAVDEFEFEDIR